MKTMPPAERRHSRRSRALMGRGAGVLLVTAALACSGSPEDERGAGAEAADEPAMDMHAPVLVAGALQISMPRAPEPAAGDVASLYLTIRNTGADPDTLLSITTPAAASASLHESRLENGMARMSAIETLVVPPGGELSLEPGGLHGMLMGLTRTIRVGDTLEVTLHFSSAGDVAVVVPIVSYADLESGAGGHTGHPNG